MTNHQQLITFLHETQQWLAEGELYHRNRLRQITDRQHQLAKLLNDARTDGYDTAVGRDLDKIAIANGRRLLLEEFTKLNEDECDVILDMTAYTLRFRVDPEDHTQLIERDLGKLENVGPLRIKLLKYMLEHPGRYISVENAAICHGNPDEKRVPATLRKTISLLRQSLGTPGPDNPYIRTKRSVSPCVYVLNPEWRYLLIKWET